MTQVCTQCSQDLPLSEFNFKDRKRGKLHKLCRICSRKYFRGYYAKHREKFVQRSRKKNATERQCYRQRILEFLRSHPCVDCGEADPIVLQFDHEDPSAKSANVGNLLRRRVAWAKIHAEIEKCVVRCANHHQRRTASQFRLVSGFTGQGVTPSVRPVTPFAAPGLLP
jgi:hypothetical protein